jgi:hypothetical protein
LKISTGAEIELVNATSRKLMEDKIVFNRSWGQSYLEDQERVAQVELLPSLQNKTG